MCELLACYAAQMGDIEFLDRLDRGETGGADAGLAAVGLTGGNFPLEAGDEELGVRPGLLQGAFGQPFGGVQQGRGFHRPGQKGQIGGGLTACPGPRRGGGLGGGGHQEASGSSCPPPPSMRVTGPCTRS
jgi:hypothetical protein